MRYDGKGVWGRKYDDGCKDDREERKVRKVSYRDAPAYN